jgi:hypothetical protein
MAEADQQFRHFISAETVVSALSLARAAPLTTKDARQRLKGYGDDAIGIVIMRHAKRLRDVKSPVEGANERSVRKPCSVRVSVTVCEP